MRVIYLILPRLRLRISVFALPAFALVFALEGALPFVILISSAFLHEAGHLIAIKNCGSPIRRVDILPMGALIVYPDEMLTNTDEIRIALAGPLFSMLGALASSLVFLALKEPFSLYAVLVNLLLALINLLPVSSLDGGRALAALLRSRFENEKAEHISSALSVTSKTVFAVISLAAILAFGFNAGVLMLSAAIMIQIIM